VSEVTIDDIFGGQNPFGEESPVQILDRSTLERWANCPQQARHVAQRGIDDCSYPTVIGTECHNVIAAAIANVVESDSIVRPHEFADALASTARATARPDVQARVSEIIKRCAWTLGKIICERSTSDIMRFDGGKGKASGQLGWDIAEGRRVTGEMDLLLATPSREQVELWDWKSGWTHWTATDVSESFQFQTYAWLILKNYPDVQSVSVRVLMLAENEATPEYIFRRDQVRQIEGRLMAAVDMFDLYHDADADNVPAWPLPTKCCLCPATKYCRFVHHRIDDVEKNTADAIRKLVVLRAETERIESALTTIVRKDPNVKIGGEIVAESNGEKIAWGVNKPRKPRAESCDLYEVGSNK
jgi:hypothetical protein